MESRTLIALTCAAALAGTVAALTYAHQGLTLSHYDARAHLVVARRIADSITPGWQQIGAVWLPLPHLLNAIPVQVEFLYRTGAFAVALSILSFAVAVMAVARIVTRLTGSRAASVAAGLLFAMNPSLLYLQSTPMTEPLALALTVGAVAILIDWCHDGEPRSAHRAGCLFALACLTRYEAWPVTGSALAFAALQRRSIGDVRTIAVYPAAAIAAFVVFSRVVGGTWYASGFFVPDNPAQGHPLAALVSILQGVHDVGGHVLLAAGAIGAGLLIVRGLHSRDAIGLIALTLGAAALVSWVAYIAGHPYRARYAISLLPLEAICAGVAIAAWKPRRGLLATLVVGLAALELNPLSAASPVVTEAQWDMAKSADRQSVTACLEGQYAGETIMVSLGALSHYVHELSTQGFAIADFLHEGNGDIWLNALEQPRPFVGWILVDEEVGGGGPIAVRARRSPAFLKGYERLCARGGVALYRRMPASPGPPGGHSRVRAPLR